ncbi:hypothetical protein H4R21_002168, partial [Coemansia helicoidea]
MRRVRVGDDDDDDMPWPWGGKPQPRFPAQPQRIVRHATTPSTTHAAGTDTAPRNGRRAVPQTRLNAKAKPFCPGQSNATTEKKSPQQVETGQDNAVDQPATAAPSECASALGDDSSSEMDDHSHDHAPLFAFPASEATVLSPASVVALHSSDSSAPVLSGGGICYPQDFLKQFSRHVAPHPGLRRVLEEAGCYEGTSADPAPSGPCDARSVYRARTLPASPAPPQSSRPSNGVLWRSATGAGRGAASKSPDSSHVAAAAVKPLEKSAGRFVPRALKAGAATAADDDTPEAYDRRGRVLLNKLTPDNFGTVSDRLLALGEEPATAAVDDPMRRLVALIFAKAVDEKVWMGMYVDLCVKLIRCASGGVVDSSLPHTGGMLVRTHLLSQCQKEFERGWTAGTSQDMESDEYYEETVVKRRGLGLARFIGELFLQDVATPNIVHSCIAGLLDGASGASPDPAKAESASALLAAVGSKLNEPTSRARLSQYMARVRAIIEDKHLPNTAHFALMDVVDLHRNNWVPLKKSEGPTTIAKIHEAAARDRASTRSTSYSGRTAPRMPRSKTDDMAAASRAGDLSRFGDLGRSRRTGTGMVPAGNPFGAFASRMSRPKGASAPATPMPSTPTSVSTSNSFSALADSGDEGSEKPAPAVASAPPGQAAPASRTKAMVAEVARLVVDCRQDQVEKIAAIARLLRAYDVPEEDAIVAGLAEYAGQLDDIVLDAPHAFNRFGLLAAAAGVPLARMSQVLCSLSAGKSAAAVASAYSDSQY